MRLIINQVNRKITMVKREAILYVTVYVIGHAVYQLPLILGRAGEF